jgi:membrane peptidoglycan carboxypeptidase
VRFTNGLLKMLSLCLLAGVLLAGMLFPVVGALGVASNRASDTIDSAQAEMVEVPPALITTITDNGGKPIATLYDQYRIPVAADQISPIMKAALISIEDRRFYEHHGVDWKGTFRAALSTSGGNQQGGSTLTQQYVKNYLINVVYRGNKAEQRKAQEPTIARKLREARIALQLEQKMTKEEILAGYLNVVEFSNEIYGIGAAAATYFGTTADKLTVPQAALLAGMVNNPTTYNPWKNGPAALTRRNTVLETMVQVGRLSAADGEAAKKEPLGVLPEVSKPAKNCNGAGPEAGFFCQYVVTYLEKLGLTEEQINTGGFTIKTSLDLNATKLAKAAAEGEVPKDTNGIANAMAIVRPGKDSHQVVALVSNRDFGPNAAAGQTQYPQPYGIENKFGAGSIYKIFTAAAALEKGMGIYNQIDVPATYTSHLFTGGNPKTCPRTEKPNDGRDTSWYCLGNAGKYTSPMTMQDALATSPNTAFVKLEESLGSTDPAVDMAIRLGMRDTMSSNMDGNKPKAGEPNQAQHFKSKPGDPGNAAFTLGPSPTSPLELANVAATLISGGVWCPPTPIVSITDRNGKPVDLKSKELPCEQAVAEPLANSLVVGLSKDDTGNGTSADAARRAGWARPMMGKTGTTQEYKSAGFVGAVPQYAAAVLTFNDGPRPRPITVNTDPPSLASTGNIYGGKVPARTWFAAMNPLLGNEPVLGLPAPDPRYTDGGQETKVPSVVGLSVEDATNKLKDAGYNVAPVNRDDAARRGTVVGQTPRGSRLPGETITIYVSTGVVPPIDTPSTPPDQGGGAPGGPGGDGGGDPGGGGG